MHMYTEITLANAFRVKLLIILIFARTKHIFLGSYCRMKVYDGTAAQTIRSIGTVEAVIAVVVAKTATQQK